MYSTIFKLSQAWSALFLLQLSIKLLDDYLDQDQDDNCRLCLADHMGQGVLSYIMLMYAVAARLSPNWSFSIFISCYACGMLASNNWLLPSGLPAQAETGLVLILGTALIGWEEMLSSLVLVLGVHLLDDVLDEKQQREHVAIHNFAHRWGRTEIFLLGIIFNLAALFLNPLKAALSWSALPLVLYVAANPLKSEKR